MIKEKDWIENSKISLPNNETVFAVGDVHGDYDLLKELVDHVDNTHKPNMKISVGDIIDRGPESLNCVKFVHDNFDVFLPGNHEVLLIGTIFGLDGYADCFFSNGGNWFYEEFKKYENSGLNIIQIAESIFGKELFDWFVQYGKLTPTSLYNPEIYFEIGNLLFVHGGVSPSVKIEDWVKTKNVFNFDMNNPLWIREEFLNWKNDYDSNKIIIHGHSFEHYADHLPTEKYKSGKWPYGHTEIDGFRMGLDTGAFATGVLTGVLFQDGRYKVINNWK